MDMNNKDANTGAKKKFSNAWIYIPLLLLLVASNIFFFYRGSDDSAQAVEEILTKDSTINILRSEYSASLLRLDDLKSQNSKLDSLLNNKDSEIGKIKGRIDELTKKQKMTDLEYREAKQLIASLNEKILGYEAEIQRLKDENQNLTTQVGDLNTQNQQLNEKIDLAKMLHASNIRILAIDLKKKGTKEVETTRARKVDVLRVQFDMVKNLIAESSNKELFIVIKTPQGELLSNAALGSGSFITAEGNSKYYSISKSIYLEQGKPLEGITVDWSQSAPYAKGDYHVEIYYKGHLIGSGKAALR